VLFARRRIDVGKFRNLVPITGWFPNAVDLLGHIEVAVDRLPGWQRVK
jgi:hypothetical protein